MGETLISAIIRMHVHRDNEELSPTAWPNRPTRPSGGIALLLESVAAQPL